MKLAKFLKTPVFAEFLKWLLLNTSGFQPATLLKKPLWQRCFSLNFAKFLIISFDRIPPNNCFLCLSVNFEKFFRAPLHRVPPGNCLFHVQAAEFQPPDAVKNYSTESFQEFYTRTRSNHSKLFKYIKFLKIICEEFLMKLRDSNFIFT